MRKLLSACLVLILALPLNAADLPNLGSASQQELTPAQEREIGEGAMSELRRSGGLAEDPEIVAYLNQLGAKLVEASGNADMRFTFFPVLDRSVNAFAMPGGYVGVYTGLMVISQHESELASVLSHEIAHVTQHHLARMLEGTRSSPLVTLASIGAAILAAHAGNSDAMMSALVLGSSYNTQKQLDYTYAFEQEADRIGMQTLTNAGFDPAAMPVFFERMQKHNRLVESNSLEFLRTHPVTYKRIADAQSRLTGQPYRQTPDSADFLFVREKARGLQLNPVEAIEFYQKTLAEKRYANEAAHRYGLAHALFLADRYDEAWLQLQQTRKAFGKAGHPALEFLAGSIRLGQGRNAEALSIFSAGVDLYPSSRALAYGLVDAQFAAGQLDKALEQIDDYQQLYPGDAYFYQRAARVYAKQGKLMQQYKAQGEYYARLQEYNPAIEQLQMALKQPGNDFYLLSSIEARLRELQAKAGRPENRKPGE